MEYLTLFFDMPFMPLLADIRQGVFYAQLLSFWLVFAGEHMLIQDGASTLKTYWKHLSAVVIGCISLFAFDVCERGAQLRNPFYSMWMTKIGANIAVRTRHQQHTHIHRSPRDNQIAQMATRLAFITVHLHHIGRHIGMRVLCVLVLHDLVCIL